jgi:molybdate transport system substrate-binding protein
LKGKTPLKKYLIPLTVIFILVSLLAVSGCAPAKPTLNVSAAGSLTDVISEINKLYAGDNPQVDLTENFASSGTLQTQIENGAPTDVFLSAAQKQMNALQDQQLIIDESRKDLLCNKVVLIVPSDSELDITGFEDLTGDLVQKIAIGDPDFVPAGMYAKQTFEQLGIMEQLQSKLVMGSDVRQVLIYVEEGNVDAGIVFITDALLTDRVKVVSNAPDNINNSIVYPVAIIKTCKDREIAQAYIDYLYSNEAKMVFEKYGFTVVEK